MAGWSKEHEKILRDHYQAKGAQWCADQVGRTFKATAMKAKYMGVARKKDSIEYRSNPQIDAVIRRAYASEEIGAINKCARALGHNKNWVLRRAHEMGLSTRQINRAPFSDAEEKFVLEHRHLSRHRIANLMREKGWHRGARAIGQLINRVEAFIDEDGYMTTGGVADLMGVNYTCVSGWINRHLLPATRKDGRDDNRSRFVVHERDLAKFIVRNAGLVVLAKVDSIWLIDLLARHGGAALYARETKMDTLRHVLQVRPELEHEPTALAPILDTTPESVSVMMTRIRAERRSLAA